MDMGTHLLVCCLHRFQEDELIILGTNCRVANCAATGVSAPGACIADSTGVMSLFDIKDIIAAKSLNPALVSAGMYKYIAFNNGQWVGYDDAETVAMKKGWANDFCFGGTMQWAIDLGSF